ncbi:cytochrome C oxidase subunit II [Defluviimonas sp. 20V17]|uniref:Leucyl aminopeptidase n=1 Tax=Allgaiera indica TaxID=765699 RepID=A0AAN4URE9_9RHOB|nr:leucyl aminopeptidase family protein [Allgaiera indica]KDB02718.1 cytochrome C oxidase subunit II [Defluviimonas sp. 20V17]GHE01737.1 leucyl aminopeptidase [Allgaiera indica]SDW94036.1 leucyl aminopeptidase [Allgaiera indica]
MSLSFAPRDTPALPLYIVPQAELATWLTDQPDPVARWIKATAYDAAPGALALLPDGSGALAGAVIGADGPKERVRGRFGLARAASQLPQGVWKIASPLAPDEAEEAALGWLLASYRFARYSRDPDAPCALLQAPQGVDATRVEAIAAGEVLTRDLINTPASDMGPQELEAATRALAEDFGAAFNAVTGEDLLRHNFPMIHAVGRASPRAPRLLEVTWGEAGPLLTLVGKGVCFDTGGLDLKPASAMGLMKKDMGGAATVLGLARMIMALALPLRLRVLIPAVENSVAGEAFRPGDILTSRKGLTVEVNNTDAEGRLVLADALALACEDAPDLVVSMATLTGAARVAVGPDLAPFYTDDDGDAQTLLHAGRRVGDPLWRMPFWDPYEEMIEPGIADLDNAPSGGMAGSITAALFLRRFAQGTRYIHFDIYGHQPKPAPARPKGGVGQGARAILDALPGLLGI